MRPLGSYVDGDFVKLMDGTGLGTSQWIIVAGSTPTWDTSSAQIPAGPDWTPYAYDEDWIPRKWYHGVPFTGEKPFFAYPGIPWMWGDQNARIANVTPIYPRYRWPGGESYSQSITLHKNFCEVRFNELQDKDGFIIAKPLTFNAEDERKWALLRSSLAGFSIKNVNRKSGAIEFLLNMEQPKGVNEVFSAEQLDPDYLRPLEIGERKTREHTMEFICGDFLSPVSFTFGLHGPNGLLHSDRATTDIIRMTEEGTPAHYVAGMRGGQFSDGIKEDTGSGYAPALAPIRNSLGEIVEFEWGKWYRFRIEWDYGRQSDGTLDVRYRMYHGDPRARLVQGYFHFVTETTWVYDEETSRHWFRNVDGFITPLVNEWRAKEIIEIIKNRDPDDPVVPIAESIFEQLTSEDGRVTELSFTQGFEYPSPSGQRFHLARIGASWDPDYIEYGTTTELVQDPYPAVIEAVVDTDIHDQDVVIEIEYLPAYFREYGRFKTSLGTYDTKQYSVSMDPKTFTFTIPAFTRRGRLFQGPSDFGQFLSATVSGGDGGVLLHAIIGDGAKIFHASKPMDAIDTLYKLKQSISKGPRLCPRCRGIDDVCPVCLGKKFRKEDSEIPEFILDEILRYHGAPANDDTPLTEKIGLVMAITNTINPITEDIRTLFSRLVDVDPTSVKITRYGGNQNVLVSISVPLGRGPNALLSSFEHLRWVAETIRPPGVEYVFSFSEVDDSETITVEDMWGLKW